MKKIFLSILTLLYMGISSGMAMEIHYCMGKKAGFDLYAVEEGKCGKCGMKEKKGGCCRDEHKFYKLSDAHQLLYNDIHIPAQTSALTGDLLFAGSWHCPALAAAVFFTNYTPPDLYGPPSRVWNGVFRI